MWGCGVGIVHLNWELFHDASSLHAADNLITILAIMSHFRELFVATKLNITYVTHKQACLFKIIFVSKTYVVLLKNNCL